MKLRFLILILCIIYIYAFLLKKNSNFNRDFTILFGKDNNLSKIENFIRELIKMKKGIIDNLQYFFQFLNRILSNHLIICMLVMFRYLHLF